MASPMILTPQQMVDILFQKPERITAGMLEQRSLWEKTRDRVLSYDNTSIMREDGGLEGLKRRLMLEFAKEANVIPEHPRSVRNAMLELKALGFSNEQTVEIASCLKKYMSFAIDVRQNLYKQVISDFPDTDPTAWCDDAFLSVAFWPKDKDKIDSRNSVFTVEAEAIAYEEFPSHMEQWYQAKPHLFTPAHPTKRCVKALQPG